jgi:signal transduction histidine kinase
MDKELRILIIEDCPDDTELLLRDLRKAGFHPDFKIVDNLEALPSILTEKDWQIIISDYQLRGFSGIDALKMVLEAGKDIPFIILSGVINEEVAVEAMKAGARDYIMKDRTARLFPAIERELREAGERQRLRQAEALNEKHLRYTQKMEAMENLSGGLAHEFNTVLTTIIGYSDIISRKMAQDDPLREYLTKILSAADRGSLLIRRMLVYCSRHGAHQHRINLSQLVEGLIPAIEKTTGDRIKVITELSDNGVDAALDSTQMEQILTNLALNARDAMPDGGTVTVKTSRCMIDEGFIQEHGFGTSGEYAYLSFSDNGKGMNNSTREKAFDPFFTTKEIGKGTGLGLALVYGMVKQHHGYITISSTEGNGTTVTIYFPVPHHGELP